MPRDVTLTFHDNTQHVYKDVPDDVTPDQITERAQVEFPKDVIHIDGGKKSANASIPALKPAKQPPDISTRIKTEFSNAGNNVKRLMDDLAGTANEGFQAAKTVLSQPQNIMGAAADAATGAVGGIAGSVAGGLHAAVKAGWSGNDAGVNTLKEWQSNMTPPAQSPTGESARALTAIPMKAAKDYTRNVGAVLGRIGGNENLGETLGEAAPDAAAALLMKGPRTRGPLPEKEAAIADAMNAGYKAMPNVSPNAVNSSLTAVGKKPVVQNTIELHNQQITNKLAKEELGADPDQPLKSDKDFERQRAPLYKPYEEIANAPFKTRIDAKLKEEIADVTKDDKEIQQSFPELQINKNVERSKAVVEKASTWISPKATLALIKKFREEAAHDKARVGVTSEEIRGANAKIKMADALENHLDRSVQEYRRTVKNPAVSSDIVQQMRDSRRQIAKSHDVQEATNPVTGDVDASKLADGDPTVTKFTGNLKKIVEARKAMPNVVKNMDGKVREPQLNVSDAAVGGLGMAASGLATHGNIAAAMAGGAAMMTRPAAHALVTSKMYQKLMVRPKGAINTPPSGIVRPAAAALTMTDSQNTPWRPKDEGPDH